MPFATKPCRKRNSRSSEHRHVAQPEKRDFRLSPRRRLCFLSAPDYWRTGSAQRPKFRTVPVMRGDLFIGVTATGTVEPVEIIDVGTQIVGSIKSFGPDADRPGKTIDYRSRVKQGDVLAQLDDLPARAELDKARVNLPLCRGRTRAATAPSRNRPIATIAAPRNCKAPIPWPTYENAMAEHEMAKAETGDGRGQSGTGENRRETGRDQPRLHRYPLAGRRRGDRPHGERRPNGGGRNERAEPVPAGQGPQPHAGVGRRQRGRHRRHQGRPEGHLQGRRLPRSDVSPARCRRSA